MSSDYHSDLKKKNTIKLRKYLVNLPPFAGSFFRGISDTTSPLTQIGYAYDLLVFFEFLLHKIPKFDGKNPGDFTLDDLSLLTSDDIEEYIGHLSFYTKIVKGKVKEYQNEEPGKSRKFAAVRSMLSYFYKRGKIPSNPAELVDFPKRHEKAIIRLEPNEVVRLLNEVETAEHMSERQKKIHEQNKKRDLAIITLLLGSGMRVSECVGINIEHVNFDSCAVKIRRKGGNEVVLYFGDEVRDALLCYLDVRGSIVPLEGHESAMFLSLQRRRITDRAVQNLVRKYSRAVISLKKISPHKLRSTYGTNLYRESGDIYLVANVLGHADVNTTKKHYAAIDEDKRKSAANYIKLRKV